jgi:hypothetical protein
MEKDHTKEWVGARLFSGSGLVFTTMSYYKSEFDFPGFPCSFPKAEAPITQPSSTRHQILKVLLPYHYHTGD